MTGFRLYVATDDGVLAALQTFQCMPARVPTWAAILADPAAILAIPDGARAIGIWHVSRQHRSTAEWAWIERRERGGLRAGLTAAEIDGLSAWIAARDASRDRVAIGDVAATPQRERISPGPADLPGIHHPAPQPIAGAVLSSRWT